MAGASVHVAVESVTDASGLIGDEVAAVEKAVPKRQAEFAAGRRAAREALAPMGLGGTEIPKGEDRRPHWPSGVVGSISHQGTIAIAAAAPDTVIRALGIDLAEAVPLADKVRPEILVTARERALPGLDAMAVFSAKETIYKALHPIVGRYFGFGAVELTPDLDRQTFEGALLEALGPFQPGAIFRGRMAVVERWIVTTLVLPERSLA